MKRVVSLYLPDWSIDRLRRIERRNAPPAEADSRTAFDAIGAEAAAERVTHCSVPKEGGWRPGARWARTERAEVEAAMEALPAHRRPPQRELGRVSEAAENPFRKGLSRPPEERVAAPAPLSAQARPATVREMARRTEAAEPLFRPGTRGWEGEDLQARIDAMPPHQRPRSGELSRKSEVIDNPFRPMPSDEVGANLTARVAMPPLRFPGEDAPAKAGRGAALRDERRDRYRNETPPAPLSVAQAAALLPVHGPGEDVVVRRAIKASDRAPRRSARDGHGGEAGYIAPPSLAQLAAMPAVQFPGEGPHPDNHGKSAPTAPTYGQGRFFQTGGR